jgi:hypothetical protein
MRRLAALACAATLAAADSPSLFYSRSFPGSAPAYFQLTVSAAGGVEYREAPDDDNPLQFTLAPAESAEVFALAERLGYFSHPLESHAKVAFTGTKTFRYENGGQKGEVQFNYTEDPSARDLEDWFERMGESARDRIELERTAKYDKIGVLDAVMQIETALNRKRLVALDQFLPMLDRIVANESYMNAARERAARIAAAIRNPKP